LSHSAVNAGGGVKFGYHSAKDEGSHPKRQEFSVIRIPVVYNLIIITHLCQSSRETTIKIT